MEILQYLLSLLLKNFSSQSLAPIVRLLEENNFNLSKVLQNIKLEKVLPIIKEFINSEQFKNENPTECPVGNIEGLKPIVNLADKQIVDSLNRYFCTEC